MLKRDEGYTLEVNIELDNAFFGAPTEGGKRGRGIEKNKVLVSLSLNKKGQPLYVKWKSL